MKSAKVITLGTPGCGKSTYVRKLINYTADEKSKTTNRSVFLSFRMSAEINLEIWDIGISDAGYRVLHGQYFEPYFVSRKTPRVALLFLDLSGHYKDQITFLKKMMYLLKYSFGNQSVVFHLIGTKEDLVLDKDLIKKTLSQAKNDLELFSLKRYIHISRADNTNDLHQQLSQSIQYMYKIPTPHKHINSHWFTSDVSAEIYHLENIVQQIVNLENVFLNKYCEYQIVTSSTLADVRSRTINLESQFKIALSKIDGIKNETQIAKDSCKLTYTSRFYDAKNRILTLGNDCATYHTHKATLDTILTTFKSKINGSQPISGSVRHELAELLEKHFMATLEKFEPPYLGGLKNLHQQHYIKMLNESKKNIRFPAPKKQEKDVTLLVKPSTPAVVIDPPKPDFFSHIKQIEITLEKIVIQVRDKEQAFLNNNEYKIAYQLSLNAVKSEISTLEKKYMNTLKKLETLTGSKLENHRKKFRDAEESTVSFGIKCVKFNETIFPLKTNINKEIKKMIDRVSAYKPSDTRTQLGKEKNKLAIEFKNQLIAAKELFKENADPDLLLSDITSSLNQIDSGLKEAKNTKSVSRLFDNKKHDGIGMFDTMLDEVKDIFKTRLAEHLEKMIIERKKALIVNNTPKKLM